MKNIYIALILFAFQINNLFAQETVSFKKSLEIGLEQNLSLRLIKNSELIEQINLNYAKGYFLPTIEARATYSNTIINSKIVRDTANIQIRDGAKTNTLNSGIYLNWTVFDGLAMFVNYSKQNELLKQGELTTRLNIETLAAKIGTEYFNFYQQTKRLTTLQYVLELSKERQRISYEKYRIGSLSKLDYQQDQIELNADSSRYLRQIEAIENARLNLNNVLAIPADSTLLISDSIVVLYGLNYTDLYNSTLATNTSLLLASKTKVLSKMEINLINSRFFPTLYLTGGYTFYNNESQAGLTSLNRQYGWNYGVGLSFPIFNKLDIHRQRSIAKINIENAAISYKQIEMEIISELNIIYNAYQNNIRIVELEKQNLQVALNNFEIAQERYRIGNLSGLEMREIQRMYLDAEDRLLNAQYQAKLAEISLKLISGKIQDYL